MKQILSLWDAYPSDGRHLRSVYLRLLIFVCMLATASAGWAADATYVPQGKKTISAYEVVYASSITGAGDPATSWVVVPNYGTSTNTYTKFTSSASTGNPQSITDAIESKSSAAMIQIKADGNTLSESKRVVHMHVTGTTGVIAHGYTSSAGRGLSISCTEYVSGSTTTMETSSNHYSFNRSGSGGSLICQVTGLDSSKEYIVSIYASGSDANFYCAEFLAATSSGPTVTSFTPSSGSALNVGATVKVDGSTSSTVYYKWSATTLTASEVVSTGTAGTSGAATVTTTGISSSATTLYAVAVKDGTNSELATASYTISDTPPVTSTTVVFKSTTKDDNNVALANLSAGDTRLVGSGIAKLIAGGSAGLNAATNKYGYRCDGGRLYIVYKFDSPTTLTIQHNAGSTGDRYMRLFAFSSDKALSEITSSDWTSKTQQAFTSISNEPTWESGTKATVAAKNNNTAWNYSSGGCANITWENLPAGYYVLDGTGSEAFIYSFATSAASTQYDIHKAESTNGSFVTKVGGTNVTKASEDATVTIAVSPASGYVTNTVSVAKTAGGDVNCTGSGNEWTFTMPGEAVTVTATFKMAAPSRTVISGSATNTGTNEYSYAESLTLKLTKPASATKMYYTLDGTDPTSSATKVEVTTNEVTLPEFTEASTTLKYYATDGTLSSDVVDITLINTAAGKVDPTLTWSKTSETATMGVAFTSPTLTKAPDELAVTYASSNESVAKVNDSGVVTLFGAGTATITANSAEQTIGTTTYKAASASYTLTVNNQTVTLAWATAGAKSMTIDETYTNAAAATSTATSAAPSTGTVTYSSSNTAVATVTSAGVVTAVAPGTATITASYAANGIYNAATPITYEVTVRAASSGKVWDFTADESANYAAATTYWQVDGSSTNYFKGKFSASTSPYRSTYAPETDSPEISMLNGIRFQRNGSSISGSNYRWYVPKDGNDGYLRFGGSNYGIVLTGLTAGTTFTIDCQASGNNDFVISNADITQFGTTTRGETQFTVSEGKTEVFIYAKNSDSKIFKITEGASTTVTVAEPTVTPKTGSEEDNTFATNQKTVDFACATEGATIKYVVGTTKQTDIGAIKNDGITGGSNTNVDVSAGVTGQCNLWISAVAVKTVESVDYTSDPFYVELVYAGAKTAELRKTDIEMQSGNYSTISTRITDNAGNPILFGEEDISDVDYNKYYDFSYEITDKTSDYITLQEIEGQTVVNSRVGDNKAPATSTATVRVTAMPKEGSGVEAYVANATATLTVDVNVKILEETQGLGWVDFYWDEACTKPITTQDQGVTGPAKDKTMVFDNFPNGKVIYLKMNTAEADTICFYYNNYDQTKPSANVSKTSGRSIITKNSTNSKLARSASYLYRHAIPIYMHEELTGDPAGKKVWVSVAGWKGTSSAKVGNIINMEFTLANNGLKTAGGTRPAAPTYEPATTNSSSGTMTKMTTTQSSIAVGEPTGMIYAKYSTKDTYNIIYLVNMPSDDNPRTLNVGRGSVGVFSTVSSTSGTTRKTSGVQIVDGVVSDISNAFYKYYPAQKEVKMSFDKTDVTVHFNNTSAFVKPTLTITPAEGETHIRENVTYSYTGGDGRITGITNDGTITWKENPTPGVITVKASFAGDNYEASPSYARAEATYQIYVIDPDKEVVLIKPGSCDFYGQMDVTIEGANTWTGYYTTTESDTEPTFNASTWSVIEHAQSTQIHLTETTNVWAYVVDPETGQPKNGTHQKFTLKTVAKPTLYPDGVTSTYYFHGTSLQVTASTSVAEASVYYVVDGDKNELANGGGTRYEGRITLDDTKMHTIYAVTQDKDGHRSEIVTGTYMKASTLEQPWFNINNQLGGDFEGGQKEINTSDKIYLVDKTGDTRADIYYTVDGSSPTTSSTKYTGAFHINKSGTVVKAISVLLGDISEISTATFTFAASSENRFWEANNETCDKNGKLLDNDGKSGAVISEANNSRSYVKHITATFGGINKDSKDVWKHEKVGEESKGEPIDGVGTYQISTGYDALDETCILQGSESAMYNHANSATTKAVHERTFTLPARGAYVKFEPEKDGDLTIWALQNGGVYYNESSDGKENFLSGFIRKRPVYMVDEQGNCLAATEVKAAGTLSSKWKDISRSDLIEKNGEQGGITQKLFTKAEAQSIYDMYSAKIENASTENIQDLIVYLNDSHHEDAANAGITGGDTSTGENIGVCIPSASYMRYTYKVRAGKTYFFFASRTKLGIRGFRFDPSTEGLPTPDATGVTTSETGTTNSTAINTAAVKNEGKTVTRKFTTGRTLTAGKWYGLVLPFSISESKLKTMFDDGNNTMSILHFRTVEGSKIYLRKHYHQMIVAGTPVLIYVTKTGTLDFDEVQVEAASPVAITSNGYSFTGTFDQITLPRYAYYINTTGGFSQWTSESSTNLKSMRSYMISPTQGARRLTFAANNYDDEDDEQIVTGIEYLFYDDDATKHFGNSDVYNLNGQIVRKNATSLIGLPKGIYIVNGKKIAVK